MLRLARKWLGIPHRVDQLMIRDFRESSKFTQDVPYLERFDCQKIFVCDDMQSSHPEHERLGINVRLISAAYTVDPFTMWKKPLGDATYAIPLLEKTFSADRQWSLHKGLKTHIRGSLHIIRPYQIYDVLDKHYQNGVEFDRVQVDIAWPYRERSKDEHGATVFSKEKIGITKAWMYVGKREFWDQIEARQLEAVRCFAPKDQSKPPYYLFTSQEYRDK